MSQLRLVKNIHECEQHGWSDLLGRIDSYTQSLIDTPSAAPKIKTAMVGWSKEVEARASRLPPNEEQVAMRNPVMQLRQFGADD